MRTGGIKSQAVDSVLIGIDRRKARLRQQVVTKRISIPFGGLLGIHPPARNRDLDIHPAQPCSAAEGADRAFLPLSLPKPQNLLHRQTQTDDILAVYSRLLQRFDQQLGKPVNARLIQRNFFVLL